MRKQQLHDCCGAQHIFGFEHTRYQIVPGTTIRADDYLRALCAHGHQTYGRSVVSRSEISSYHPGVTSIIITANQKREWGELLVELGFRCVVDNIKNRNTQHRLFFYVRIESPYRSESITGIVDGVRRGVRMKDANHPYRIRNAAGVLVIPTDLEGPVGDTQRPLKV